MTNTGILTTIISRVEVSKSAILIRLGKRFFASRGERIAREAKLDAAPRPGVRPSIAQASTR